MRAWYNENDPKTAAWLRELIAQGLIADGEVDERSIEDVKPKDLEGFTQCHFFAGIGVWSYALRNAGWPDDAPVWSGSCPCQGFSASGARGGFSDKRHLWPAWFRLIEVCKPDTIFGEQVASKDGLAWLDVVSADMEGAGYAIGSADLCAAGFGAPHIRQRLYFVADPQGGRLGIDRSAQGEARHIDKLDAASVLGNAAIRRNGALDRKSRQGHGQQLTTRRSSLLGGLAVANGIESSNGEPQRSGQLRQPAENGSVDSRTLADTERNGGRSDEQGREAQRRTIDGRTGQTNGFWRDAEWLHCKPELGYPDGRWRPVEPGTFPLATGAPARVGRLRGYGNALVAPVAQAFIEAYLETSKGHKP